MPILLYPCLLFFSSYQMKNIQKGVEEEEHSGTVLYRRRVLTSNIEKAPLFRYAPLSQASKDIRDIHEQPSF